MTREEAIDWLNCLKEIHEDDIADALGTWYKDIKNDHNEVIDMAIEALNHSEIPNSFGKDTNVPSNDTISRKQAIDKLETIGYDFSDSELSETELEEVCEAVGDVRQDMIRMIKRLPPAQPESCTNMECPYCREDSGGYVKPLEKNCHAFIRFGMNGWEINLSAKGWHGSAKVMYCPMCGRRLKNDK